ncbi:uncharacterized membrane protein YvlD (DUF360 family) [Antricoccus suffuscus]|uniref:Uncharacterized membrane protein YvlD (DUF360 family) n=1 Tax=Antricoccus suffuscus TaxID=1629062 RepID=A0A2T0ZXK2_9ACTN|nr:phage holin family protein [Antricoccus suffuscus]PRZ41080.1 uncharacterized membrane protein YvlD (DUF360 family) [Antricoccus suffuscus]
MSDNGPRGKARVLRTGRTLARVVFIWAANAATLVLLDAMLTGFSMSQWWQPLVCALLFGLLVAFVWPGLMRVALPIAFFTLGLASILLLGAGVVAIFVLVPGVKIHGFGTAVIVAVAMAAIGALIHGLLSVDEDELFFRRAARRASRRDSTDGVRSSGVLFLQIDGLGYDTVRRAVRDGDMPTLARWIRADSHSLELWHTDWSSQTGASVCAIMHGSNEDILGFRWYEKDRDHVMACAHPGDAAEIERRHSNGRGLLAADGAAHGNLFTGDAEHVSLTMSAVPVIVPKSRRRERQQKRRVGAGYYAYFANPLNVVRTTCVAFADVAREIWASSQQKRADVRPRINRGGLYPFARVGTTVIARDIMVSAVVEDMLAGRSVVYADFLGYDEVAHHSGIERFDALAVLRSIDQQIGRIHRATELAPRHYEIVILSDHGQTQGEAFSARFGEPIEALVGRLCGGDQAQAGSRRRSTVEGWQMGASLADATAGGGPIGRRLRARVEDADPVKKDARAAQTRDVNVVRAAPGVVVVPSGHLAMVSFTDHVGRVDLETIEREFPELLPTLVDHDGVGFMLVRSSEFGPVVLGGNGIHRLATGVVIGEDPLKNYGPHAADLIRRVDTFEHCADIMINSNYDPATDAASSFETHVGSHGGLGGPQARGFVLRPRSLPDLGEVVGAEALHEGFAGWLDFLRCRPSGATHTADGDRVTQVGALGYPT